MVDMSNLLGRVAGSVEPPKSLPPGEYIFRILSVGPDRETPNGNPAVDFMCQAETPIDIDPEQLAGVEFPAKIRHTFFVTEKSLFRLSDFLIKHLGLPADETLTNLIQQTPGHIFRGMITHASSSKPGDNTLYTNIGSTSAA
jgi:hypothetical protein